MSALVLNLVGVGCWMLGLWLAWKSLTAKPRRAQAAPGESAEHPDKAGASGEEVSGINLLLVAAAVAMMIGLTCFRVARGPGAASEPATGATLAPDR